ncbi:hypothetical protein [Nostoc sp. CHAB 5836]|uniref:hypothetical protein n=1 Tax=Nostoc sp. CHAB 5836 TaxID=2780404 RepID=UPI001E3266C6|nr:hypothetical protein [Nostoc sp. CHAB 5836]
MSEIIILDTHIWIWYINRELDQFPTSWLEIITQVASYSYGRSLRGVLSNKMPSKKKIRRAVC